MPAATTIAIAGLAAAAGGTALNYKGQKDQAAAQRRAEAIRERQMQVEADRARRDALRTAMRERALANASATAQGAYAGSGIGGGVAQIQSNAGYRVGAVNTNEFFGEQLFRANEAFAQGGSVAAIGTGLTRLGSAAFTNAQTVGNIFQRPGDVGLGSWNATIRPPSHWGA